MSRVKGRVRFNWIEETSLIVENGMTGATGNIYCGLHEYADMSFVLHLLKPGDLFVDIGANIGSYSVLASGVCRARTIAIEPDPDTARHLLRNIHANHIERLVQIYETAVGSSNGSIDFTVGLDTVNHVAQSANADTRTVRLKKIDDIVGEQCPVLLKLDVEGFETEALRGAERTLSKPSLIAIETETADLAGIEILKRHKFERFEYDPVERSLNQGVTSASNNALFIRNPDKVNARLQVAPKRTYRGNQI